MNFKDLVKSLDWILISAAVLLVLIGLAMLFSSTYGQGITSRFTRQIISFALGLGLAIFMARLPYHFLRSYSKLIYAIGLIGLVIVFFSAQIIRGTASRLDLFGFQIQPSELMKVALIIALAAFFARIKRPTWRNFAISGMIVLVPVIMVTLEPDIGMAALLLAVWGGFLLFIGIPWRYIFLLVVSSLGVFGIAWHWWFAAYQKQRLLIFLDPTSDPLGAGYNIVQSIIALGSGRILGRGLGHGPQSQLKFLPEQHTDFILASIGEELGFIGIILVLILYGIVLWRILKIATNTSDAFGQLIAIGVFFSLLSSLAVAAGMNMGLVPVTGIPLPFLSYGGSNLLSTFLLLGLVESVHVYGKWVQAPPTEITHFL
jgi:rod shape determining protein RodA